MSKWYQKIDSDDRSIEQGDVLEKFPIVHARLEDKHVQQILAEHPIPEDVAADVYLVDVVVLSQSCDLANDKIESILLCPISNFDTWVFQHGDSNGKRKNLETTIRKKRNVNFHLLVAEPKFGIVARLVDFRIVYTTRKRTIEKFLDVSSNDRYRCGDLHRIDLAQRFAWMISRPALPDEPTMESGSN